MAEAGYSTRIKTGGHHYNRHGSDDWSAGRQCVVVGWLSISKWGAIATEKIYYGRAVLPPESGGAWIRGVAHEGDTVPDASRPLSPATGDRIR